MTGFVVQRDEGSSRFFDGAGEGRLLIRRCPSCGTAYAPEVDRCRDGRALAWEEASGNAVLVTWAVDHAPLLDATLASPEGTAAFGFVELSEGPWLQVPIVDADPASLTEGMAMRVRFIRPGGGEAIPAFSPTT